MPALLDLFCGGGGCSKGYHDAGFDVVGVDLHAHPNYPYPFVQADAVEYLAEYVAGSARPYAAIHASPPCKAHTKTGWAYHFNYHDRHEDLLTPTRELLEQCGTPWVIENVPGAPMRVDLLLCGSQFGLGVRRHRWFELSFPPPVLVPSCDHSKRVVSPHGNPNRSKGSAAQWAEAMDIDWMSTQELAQAIPPAYTQYVGALLLEHIGATV